MKNMKKRSVCFLMLLLAMLLVMPVTASAAKTALNKTKLTLKVGQSYRLKLKNNKKKVTWKSSNYPKVTVSTSGRVVARKKGTVTITATAGKKSYTCKVTVKQPVTKVTLNKTSAQLTVGKTCKLKATVTPSNANNKKLTWSSSDKAVATVTSSGKVKAISAGTATITAKAKDGSGQEATCTITVTEASSTTTTTTTTEISANAQKLLDALAAMNAEMKSDIAQGRYWTYGYKGGKTWAAASSGKRQISCVQMVRYAMRLAGIITAKQDVYAGSNGEVTGVFSHNGKITDEEFNEKFEVIRVNKSANELAEEGILKPGDICGYNGHENVYAGDGKWYDAGRASGRNGSWQNGTYYFDSLGPISGYSSTVVEILRLK